MKRKETDERFSIENRNRSDRKTCFVMEDHCKLEEIESSNPFDFHDRLYH